MTTVYALPAAPLSIGRVLDSGTRLFTHSFTRVLPMSLTGELATVVPSLATLLFGYTTLPVTAASIVAAVLTVIAVVVYITMYVAIIDRMGRIAHGSDASLAAALRHGYRMAVPVVLAALLYGLAVMGGLIALVIPGIYLSVSLFLFPYPIVGEQLRARAALKRSHELVRGNWWRAATVVTVPVVLMISLILALQVLPLMVLGIDYSGDQAAVSKGVEFLANLVGAIVSGVVAPWLYGVGLLLYHDLRLRKEGTDLERRAAALAGGA